MNLSPLAYEDLYDHIVLPVVFENHFDHNVIESAYADRQPFGRGVVQRIPNITVIQRLDGAAMDRKETTILQSKSHKA